jgi:hypothetical protein
MNLSTHTDPFAPLDNEKGCCGKHAFCKKKPTAHPAENPIEYYDDEELDQFQNRSADSYTATEAEQFAEVLHTMLKTDIEGWLRSLQRRGIRLPNELREEGLFVLNCDFV